MRIRIAPRPEGIPADLGSPELPTSKSHAQRALCLAHYLPGTYEILGLPPSRDVQVLSEALSQEDTATLDLLDNGTALRFLAVIPAILGQECTLDGGERLRERPLDAAVEFLTRYGANASCGWPKHLDGRAAQFPEELEVDASLTSQVASGVLLGAAIRLARLGERRVLRIRQPTAVNYLMVTLEVLAWFGFETAHWREDEDLLVELQSWTAPAEGQQIKIPLDASSFSFFAAFLAMHGLEVERTLGTEDSHPDWLFCEDLRRLLTAEPHAELVFREIHQRPDTFPCLVTMAAMRCGTTRILGIPSLRHKESDRIAAMASALEVLGLEHRELPDGIEVTGPVIAHEVPVSLPCPDDHRVVMALALLGTRLPGGVELNNPSSVDKSWPGYFDWLSRVSSVKTLEQLDG